MSKSAVIVNLFYDVSSPYSWIAFELLTRHCNVWHKSQVKLKPITVDSVYAESKNEMPCNAKIRYIVNDTQMLSEYYKVPIGVTDYKLIPDTTRAMKFLTAIEASCNCRTLERVTREMFWRVYGNNPPLDVTSDKGFDEICKKFKFSMDFVQQIDSEDTKLRLTAFTKEAIDHGAFGVPTMLIHTDTGPKLLFGQDRIELLANLINETYHGPLLQYNAFK